MHNDPLDLYPTRRIQFGKREFDEWPIPRLDADQITAVRAVVAQYAIGGHHTEPTDRSGSGVNDLVAVVTIGWDAIGGGQLLLVVTQGYVMDSDASTIDLAVVPYAAPTDGHPLHQTDKSFRPDSAAALLDEVVTAIEAIDGLAPPRQEGMLG